MKSFLRKTTFIFLLLLLFVFPLFLISLVVSPSSAVESNIDSFFFQRFIPTFGRTTTYPKIRRSPVAEIPQYIFVHADSSQTVLEQSQDKAGRKRVPAFPEIKSSESSHPSVPPFIPPLPIAAVPPPIPPAEPTLPVPAGTSVPPQSVADSAVFEASRPGVVSSPQVFGDNENQNQNVPPPSDEEGSWPRTVFAPYVDATSYPAFSLSQTATATQVQYYTLGFVVAQGTGNCSASWGTYYPIGDYLSQDIQTLQSMGGDVMVSFGGAANTELAVACPQVQNLVDEYQRVIDTYRLTRIDFDIEGAWIADTASIERRSQAIAMLQNRKPALEVWYTLPVLPTGLTPEGLAVLTSALDHDVRIDGVNIMAMDYGDGAAPDPTGKMGDYAIRAAESLFQQLKSLYADRGIVKSDMEFWNMIGVTPMLGVNDVASEVFTLSDAQKLLDYASTRGLGLLSMWSANRDKPCPGGSRAYADATCSSIEQEEFQFLRIFRNF